MGRGFSSVHPSASRWDRPSPLVVCHGSLKHGWLTDEAVYYAFAAAPFMTSQAITPGHHFEIHPLRHRRFLLAGVFIGHHDLHQVLARAQLAAERKHSAAHQARGIGLALR